MRTTFRIAQIELKKLIYSPIAWLLLILFFIQITLAYLGILQRTIGWQQTGFVDSSITFHIFANPMMGGVFIQDVLNNLYLYIPLITMGLISTETSSGTIKLLYSSPVKLSKIIFGKYFAMLVFNLLMIGMLAIIVIASSFHITSVDIGMLVSALIGFYLLLAAYAAIGLFMSCLTNYQVVAALATFAAFALLKFIGTVWQDNDFFREISNYLSIANRAEQMVWGLVSTKNVLYYLSISGMFLAFSWFKLSANRKTVTWSKAIFNYSLVVVLGIIVIFLASKPGYIGYVDMTQDKRNTISENARESLKRMDKGSLEVTNYINLLDDDFWRLTPNEINNNLRNWEMYQRFKPDMKINYVYYYDSVQSKRLYSANPGKTLTEIAEKNAIAYNTTLDKFKKPEEIQKEINLYPENNHLVTLLSYNGKSTFLRTFDDQFFWPFEEETGASLRRLTTPSMPKIAFLQGQEERSIDKSGDRGYKLATSAPNVRVSILNQGMDAMTVNLEEGNVPDSIIALVIADPRADFSPEVLAKIQNYIDEGGNLLLAGEPRKQSVLNPLLKGLGVQLMEGTLVQGDNNYAANEVKSFVTKLGDQFTRQIAKLHKTKLAVNTPGSAGLSYSDSAEFKIQPLLVTDGKVTWNKTGELVLDSAAITFNPEAGDVKKSYPTALALTRNINGKEQRILVTGDADFLGNKELAKYYPRTGNEDFFQGFLGWLSYGEFPIDTKRPDPTLDSSFKIKGDQVYISKWIMVGLIPAILVLIGTVILIRRKRK